TLGTCLWQTGWHVQSFFIISFGRAVVRKIFIDVLTRWPPDREIATEPFDRTCYPAGLPAGLTASGAARRLIAGCWKDDSIGPKPQKQPSSLQLTPRAAKPHYFSKPKMVPPRFYFHSGSAGRRPRPWPITAGLLPCSASRQLHSSAL